MSAVNLFSDRIGRQHPERVLDAFQQTALVFLDGEDIVGLLDDDLLGYRALTTHRVDGHHRAAQRQRVQQLRYGRDLFGLFIDLVLPEHQPVALGPGRDYVDDGLGPRLARAAQHLAVDGHHLPVVSLTMDETQATKRIERSEHPVESSVRRNACGKAQKRLKPLQFGLAIVGDVISTLGPAQNRGDGYEKNLFQQMLPVPLHPGIAQLSKILPGIFHSPSQREPHPCL